MVLDHHEVNTRIKEVLGLLNTLIGESHKPLALLVRNRDTTELQPTPQSTTLPADYPIYKLHRSIEGLLRVSMLELTLITLTGAFI